RAARRKARSSSCASSARRCLLLLHHRFARPRRRREAAPARCAGAHAHFLRRALGGTHKSRLQRRRFKYERAFAWSWLLTAPPIRGLQLWQRRSTAEATEPRFQRPAICDAVPTDRARSPPPGASRARSAGAPAGQAPPPPPLARRAR